ncbi:sulfotransferase family 2 domain-containing protein [Microbulbifer harenosus]|uniref:sulfotransferase family 2 domain-containing protein n=1 Tax=Microbulbifer harenosus TaxID=2576840 RepID=UPI001C700026
MDAAFKENFKGDEWVTREFPGNPKINHEQVRQWIVDNPQAKCFSSHTAMLPPPAIDGVEVFPVVFVRHPIDRIASAYAFERKQGGDSFGAVLARNTGFKGYIETRLALKSDRQCRNFHVARFAPMFPGSEDDELNNAIRAVKSLPFLGVVESFDESISLLERKLRDFGFPGLKLVPERKNVSRDSNTALDAKLESIKNELGDETYQLLVTENQLDLALYTKLV